MCIAILKPKDKTLSKEILQTCFNNNKDGCGFAYCKDGTVYINKYMKFEDFYNDYKLLETSSNMLIHFRIATHGKVELDNCHPFRLNNRMALIHNGIIPGYGDKQTKSDTRDFIDRVIGNISWKMWKSPSFQELVDKAIGYSKLCVLDKSGEYFIIGEEKGEWVDGIWFSNSSWKPPVYKSTVMEDKKSTRNYTRNNYGYYDYYNDDYDEWFANYKKQKEQDLKDKVYPSTINNTKEIDYDNCDIIWKCKKCGKELILDADEEPVCDVCKSEEMDDIGIVSNKEKYYYDDLVNTKAGV